MKQRVAFDVGALRRSSFKIIFAKVYSLQLLDSKAIQNPPSDCVNLERLSQEKAT